MTTRKELEKLKCGDKVLVNGNERIFIGLKPIEINCNCVIVCLNSDGNVNAHTLRVVEIIKPKKKLYAFKFCDGEIRWFDNDGLISNDWNRAPEWDREEI